MIKNYNTIFIDMYGVIIKENREKFISYAYEFFDKSQHQRLDEIINPLFAKAIMGEYNSHEFLAELGVANPTAIIKGYIENHLTLDEGFIEFAENIKNEYDLVLLSNDIGDWSNYITEFFEIDKYFKNKIISGNVKCRKPDLKIFDTALEIIGKRPAECMFIDNRPKNLIAAEEVGIAPILFNRDDAHYYGMVVESFKELYNLIG